MVGGEIFLLKLIFSGCNKADGGQVGKFCCWNILSCFLGPARRTSLMIVSHIVRSSAAHGGNTLLTSLMAGIKVCILVNIQQKKWEKILIVESITYNR